MVDIIASSWPLPLWEASREPLRRTNVREERLRSTAGLRGAPNLTSWRGQSGRRYVVGVHPMGDECLEMGEAVLIAVRREGEGAARIVEVAASDPQLRGRALAAWMTRLRREGATEIHVHRLAEDAQERQAVVEDLRGAAALNLPRL